MGATCAKAQKIENCRPGQQHETKVQIRNIACTGPGGCQQLQQPQWSATPGQHQGPSATQEENIHICVTWQLVRSYNNKSAVAALSRQVPPLPACANSTSTDRGNQITEEEATGSRRTVGEARKLAGSWEPPCHKSAPAATRACRHLVTTKNKYETRLCARK